MRYAISMPNFVPASLGAEVDIHRFVDWATMAEQSGWDGFFLWDHVVFWKPDDLYVMDPWVLLSAIACATSRLTLGPLITPLPRRRPWQVAREAASLDHLSKGRVVLGVGIGAPTESDFTPFGEPGDVKELARRLDEGLEIVTGLWQGERFSYQGQHYTLEDVLFLPKPNQQPRIPIWAAALWPRKAPVRRAARFDGICPIKMSEAGQFEQMMPDDYRALLDYARQHRAPDAPFDVTASGWTGNLTPRQAHEHVQTYADAGVTWWIEGLDWFGGRQPRAVEERIKDGPPR